MIIKSESTSGNGLQPSELLTRRMTPLVSAAAGADCRIETAKTLNRFTAGSSAAAGARGG